MAEMQQTKDISDPSTDRKMHDSPDISPNTPDQEPLSHDQEIASNQEQAEKRQSTLQDISHRINQLLTNTPALKSLTLMDLNTKAIQHIKEKDYISAAAIYTVLFNKAAQQNLTHPELYVCRSNFSAVYLHLELFEEALQQAEKCRILAECSLRRNYKASSGYIKSFERKGKALMGLQRHREAAAAFEQGLKLDAFNFEMKKGLEVANQCIVEDLTQGRGLETRSITYPDPSQRITYHPYSAPLHKIKTEDMLPVKLLTPFQAENDHHIKDTYNYVTVQTDILMPKRQLKVLEDTEYTAAFKRAIEQAVADIEAQDKDCRVLNLGSGAGLQAAIALKAGATHVTAVERWLYLALSCKETLVKNKFHDDQFKVVYKRPTDLALHTDVPISCNLLIANIFEEGLLASGIIQAMHHALSNLVLPDATLLPASATVYMQAIELRTTSVAGLDMSAANLYRWQPAYATGASIDYQRLKTLSNPVEVWYFDFGSPPEKSDVKTVDVEFTQDGRLNAVMFWFDLHLYGDIHISTAPKIIKNTLKQQQQSQYVAKSRPTWLQPAVQYLAGELPVEAGTTLPLIASHNTVRMRFDIETADYLHLMKPDASFPHRHFCMLADEERVAAYGRALQRVVKKVKEEQKEAHVLDIGCGTGVLSILAAKAGANSVVACDLHESLCDVTRKAAAANKVADKVSVVHRDVGLLQRGREVRALGVNVIVADMFDSGLFGDQFLYLLEMAKKKVAQPEVTVVPAGATLYCMGVEIITEMVEGFDLSEMNKYRWDAQYENIHLDSIPHRRLTKPVKVLEQSFNGEKKGRSRDTLIKLPVVEKGLMNAVVFWFDLHLDEEETLSNAPRGIGRQGEEEEEEEEELVKVKEESGDEQQSEEVDKNTAPKEDETSNKSPHYWGQALQYLDRAVELELDRKVTLICSREGSKLSFTLRQGVGDWVDRAPWKIEWGGGASIENPHFQRVHYCELLVRDFLMRVKSKRFPSIEKDMKMVLAHCGSLFLDPAALQRIEHEMVVLERIHVLPEFSPGASLEALTRPALRIG